MNSDEILTRLVQAPEFKGWLDGSYFNIEGFQVDFIFRILESAKKFRTIFDKYKISKSVKEDRTVFRFYKKSTNYLEREIIIKDTGNVIKPRNPSKCLTSPFIWALKLKFYTNLERKWFRITNWRNKGDLKIAKFENSETFDRIVRVKDDYGNQIQFEDKDKLDLDLEEFDRSQKDIYYFRNSLIKNPDLLDKPKRKLAKKFGVSRQTIHNWLRQLDLNDSEE